MASPPGYIAAGSFSTNRYWPSPLDVSSWESHVLGQSSPLNPTENTSILKKQQRYEDEAVEHYEDDDVEETGCRTPASPSSPPRQPSLLSPSPSPSYHPQSPLFSLDESVKLSVEPGDGDLYDKLEEYSHDGDEAGIGEEHQQQESEEQVRSSRLRLLRDLARDLACSSAQRPIIIMAGDYYACPNGSQENKYNAEPHPILLVAGNTYSCSAASSSSSSCRGRCARSSGRKRRRHEAEEDGANDEIDIGERPLKRR